MNNPLVHLAHAANEWQSRELLPHVVWATRRSLLDWYATTLPGSRLPPATLLSHAFSSTRGHGGAECYVDGCKGSTRYAALLNATASHTVEFDDIFKDGGYHPGSSTVAAALAVAQDINSPLEKLHRAIIGGYEVGCRIALAVQPSHYTYWHTSATIGTIGAAVSTVMLLGGDSRRIAHAMALASSFSGGHQQNLQGKGTAKPLHAGHAADAGLLAGYAAVHGATASLESFSASNGFTAATSDSTGNWGYALEGVGDWTPITRMTIKNHGCCGHIFPALDGLQVLKETMDIPISQIERIHVEGYSATYSMCDRPSPVSPQEARFSVQYCIAVYLIAGRVRLNAFEESVFHDPEVLELMRKVTVRERADIAAEYPRKRMANIVIKMVSGKEVHHFQKTRKGDPEDPLSDVELIGKYEELTSEVICKEKRDELREKIMLSSELPSLII